MLNHDGVLWVDGFDGKKEYGTMSAAAAQGLINTVSSVALKCTNKDSPSLSGEMYRKIVDRHEKRVCHTSRQASQLLQRR